jgi:hypothetical protein
VDPRQTDSEKALALAQEKAMTALEHYPVRTRVNNAKNEVPIRLSRYVPRDTNDDSAMNDHV